MGTGMTHETWLAMYKGCEFRGPTGNCGELPLASRPCNFTMCPLEIDERERAFVKLTEVSQKIVSLGEDFWAAIRVASQALADQMSQKWYMIDSLEGSYVSFCDKDALLDWLKHSDNRGTLGPSVRYEVIRGHMLNSAQIFSEALDKKAPNGD